MRPKDVWDILLRELLHITVPSDRFSREWITILLKKWMMTDSNQEKTILCSLTIDGDHTPMYPKY